jgi:hypothetical protein
MPGLQGKRSEMDEAYIKQLRLSNPVNPHILYIFDARPKNAAVGNQLMGKGYENTSFYENTKLLFCDIDNIHAISASYKKVVSMCTGAGLHSDESTWLSELENSKWLHFIKLLLIASHKMATCLDEIGASVVVHCSDGWDRTSQMCMLTQLLLDPYYRTIKGFCVLVEKEWCSFGHQFAERFGHATDHHSDQRAPIFLQGLDAVYQLVQQFPFSFEFNEHFLVDIFDEAVSGRFGTFLFDSEKERKENGVFEQTVSLWTWLLNPSSRSKYVNPLYMYNSDQEFSSVITGVDVAEDEQDDDDDQFYEPFAEDIKERDDVNIMKRKNLTSNKGIACSRLRPNVSGRNLKLWSSLFTRHIDSQKGDRATSIYFKPTKPLYLRLRERAAADATPSYRASIITPDGGAKGEGNLFNVPGSRFESMASVMATDVAVYEVWKKCQHLQALCFAEADFNLDEAMTQSGASMSTATLSTVPSSTTASSNESSNLTNATCIHKEATSDRASGASSSDIGTTSLAKSFANDSNRLQVPRITGAGMTGTTSIFDNQNLSRSVAQLAALAAVETVFEFPSLGSALQAFGVKASSKSHTPNQFNFSNNCTKRANFNTSSSVSSSSLSSTVALQSINDYTVGDVSIKHHSRKPSRLDLTDVVRVRHNKSISASLSSLSIPGTATCKERGNDQAKPNISNTGDVVATSFGTNTLKISSQMTKTIIMEQMREQLNYILADSTKSIHGKNTGISVQYGTRSLYRTAGGLTSTRFRRSASEKEASLWAYVFNRFGANV